MTATDLHFDVSPSRSPRALGSLVLLNPLGTTTAVWDLALPTLLEHFDVLRVDYPGHGGSPARDMPGDIDDLARVMLSLLDRLGIAQAHVAGVSIGGMAALRMAAADPGRILSATAICSALRMDGELWRSRARIVDEWGTGALADGLLERWFTPAFHRTSPEIVAEYERMILECPDSGYGAYCAVLADLDLSAGLADVTQPALVIVGAEDPAVPLTHGEEMARRLPNATLEVLDGVAHMAQAMAPGRVAASLIAHATAVVEG